MFLPLKDHNPTRRTPVITIALIAINVLVWLVEVGQGQEIGLFIARWGAVPYELTRFTDLIGNEGNGIIHVTGPSPLWITAFTSMFLHGGWVHLIFNMLYLWIFGNNVEDFLGRFRFILFYFGTGLVGLLVHVALHADSIIPVVGASGAISGVLGAYLVLYPGARVTTLVFLLFFVTFIEVPALVLLGFWILMQIFSGVSSLGVRGGGTAYWAHIGGFVVGYLALRFWLGAEHLKRNQRRQENWQDALGSDASDPDVPPAPPNPRPSGRSDPIGRFLDLNEKKDRED